MSTRTTIFLLLVVSLLAAYAPVVRAQMTNRHLEDFTSTTHLDDPLYVAVDTVAGQVLLPDRTMGLDGVAGSVPTPGLAYDVVVRGKYAYVADHMAGGLQVVRVYPPESLNTTGSLGTPGSAWGLEVDGHVAYVADGSSGLLVVDVSDPAVPSPVATYGAGAAVWNVALGGNTVYLALGTSGIEAVDVTNPAAPGLLGSVATGGSAYGVAVQGNLLAVAAGTSGLVLVDVADPANPQVRGSWNTPDLATDVVLAGHLAYVADRAGGVAIVDVTDPLAPAHVATWSAGVEVEGLWLRRADLFAAAGPDGLFRIDVSDPSLPVTTESILLGDVHAVDVDGDLAFVADQDGLQIVDILDPGPGCVLDARSFSGYHGDVHVQGAQAYYAGTGGFAVFDVADPAGMTPLGNLFISAENNRFALDGDHAYLAAAAGLRVVDVSDPATPILVTTWTGSTDLTDADIAGDIVYVTEGGYGLRALDVRNPAAPTAVGKLSLSSHGTVRSLAVDGNVAFVASGSYVTAVDVTDPANMAVLGDWHGANNINHLDLYGDRLFVSEMAIGGDIVMLDVSDPAAPATIWSEAVDGLIAGVVAERDRLWAFDTEVGPIRYRLYHDTYFTDPDTVAADQGAHAGALADGILFYKSDGEFRSLEDKQARLANPRTLYSENLYVVYENPYYNDVLQVRLTPVYAEGSDWGGWHLTMDGVYMDHPLPLDEWVFTDNFETVRWFTTMEDRSCATDPVLEQVDCRWLFDAAVVDSVVDVPGDNGDWVRIHATRSGYDDDQVGVGRALGYYLWRRVDDPALAERLELEGLDPTPDLDPGLGRLPGLAASGRLTVLDGRCYATGRQPGEKTRDAMPPGVWEVIGSAPAHQQDRIILTAPARTATTGPEPWSVFCVTTECEDHWYTAWPDSGYAVDNIVPGVPQDLSAAYTATGVGLDWADAPENDFQYYRVYRSDQAAFEPSPATLVHETATSDWTDPAPDPWGWHYLVTTLDDAGNESPPASPTTVSEAGRETLPTVLRLVGAVPNPFNPATILAFELPRRQEVRLDVFDAAGRRVIRLVDGELGPGRHEVEWAGRDARGWSCPAGVYLVRLQTAYQMLTQRMTLIK